MTSSKKKDKHRKDRDKKSKKKKPPADDGDQQEEEQDSRFDTSLKPQFLRPKPNDSKIVLDERFAGVLTDPRFQVHASQDKYGRRKKSKKKKAHELEAFYTIEEKKDNDEKSAPDNENDAAAESEKQHSNDDSSSSSDEENDKLEHDQETKDDDDKVPSSRIAYLTALSRGQIDVSSSSDEDEGDEEKSQQSSSDDDEDAEGESDQKPSETLGVLDPSFRKQQDDEEPLTFASSPYLAVLNVDWAHVRAVDLLATLASFCPPGACKSVHVYVSDFGQERMAKENVMGPRDIWKEKQQAEDGNKGQQSSKQQKEDSKGPGDGDDEEDDEIALKIEVDEQNLESDFDPEKLRAYEASKLKYYFAVAEFDTPEHADACYEQVNGMEFEHSSTAMELQCIPTKQELKVATADRPLRDAATHLPSNYKPPEDFCIQALQQTQVNCTWELGDADRERQLTKYRTNGRAWKEWAEQDKGEATAEDFKAYLASDNSSSSSSEEEADDNARAQEKKKKGKAANMRKLLGLDSDSEGEEEEEAGDKKPSMDKVKEVAAEKEESADEDDGEDSDFDKSDDDDSSSREASDDEDGNRQATFVPGQGTPTANLQDKIRTKLEKKQKPDKEPTPWEKYQEKRKQKRRERRQAAREKRKEVNERRRGGTSSSTPALERDDFFKKGSDDNDGSEGDDEKKPMTREELELLVADGTDDKDDFNMRELQRQERLKDTKLRGARKRKEQARAAKLEGEATTSEFQVDTADDRFRAVWDGEDDRFGIDQSNPNFKNTPGMKQIMKEQSSRRRKRRRGK